MFKAKTYRNNTELANLSGVPIYMTDMVDAALRGRLNIFLQGDTGSGKTQLARDVMHYFGTSSGDKKFALEIRERFKDGMDYKGDLAVSAIQKYSKDKSLFFLGRNDMDTRELFKRINLGRLYSKPTYNLEPLVNPNTGEVEWYYAQFNENLRQFIPIKLTREQVKTVRNTLDNLVGTTEDINELTSKINANLIVVDELPNCVPAVRVQLFNLFDGFIEVDGKAYPLGSGYSVGIATGNIGQQFTESSNELGRVLKDRMHLIIDTDYFRPQPIDTLDMLEEDRNPGVKFDEESEESTKGIIESNKRLREREVPAEKYIIAGYLVHGLDYLDEEKYGGSKIALKSGWPNKLEGHELGSDEALILPVSPRAAKSIITLSQALDSIVEERGENPDLFNSMMTAFKFASAYSGVLNPAITRQNYDENPYKAMDAVIDTARTQFQQQEDKIRAGLDMASKGRKDGKVLSMFQGRWKYMKNILENLAERQK